MCYTRVQQEVHMHSVWGVLKTSSLDSWHWFHFDFTVVEEFQHLSWSGIIASCATGKLMIASSTYILGICFDIVKEHLLFPFLTLVPKSRSTKELLQRLSNRVVWIDYPLIQKSLSSSVNSLQEYSITKSWATKQISLKTNWVTGRDIVLLKCLDTHRFANYQ